MTVRPEPDRINQARPADATSAADRARWFAVDIAKRTIGHGLYRAACWGWRQVSDAWPL